MGAYLTSLSMRSSLNTAVARGAKVTRLSRIMGIADIRSTAVRHDHKKSGMDGAVKSPRSHSDRKKQPSTRSINVRNGTSR